jgi:hypothetical protein
MKSIEDLNLLYGKISWDQIYLVIVIWALELMENKYKLLSTAHEVQPPHDYQSIA